MKKIIIFIIFCLIILAVFFFGFFYKPKKIMMSYWGYDAKYIHQYPVPGSIDQNGNIARNQDFAEKINFLNVIAYAFLHVNKNGVVHFQNSQIDLSLADLEFCKPHQNICNDSDNKFHPQFGNFNAFAKLQNKSNTLKKIISIGGAGDPDSFYYAINNVDNFVNSVTDILNYYHLAGVDLDFEINALFSAEQATSYAQLVAKLRNKLGNAALISMAVPADTGTLDSIAAKNWREIARNVNFISVMCYDFHMPSAKSQYTGYNSNLYPDPNEPDNFYHINCDQSIKHLISLDVPADKIVLGYPSYAISYGGVAVTNHGLFQSFDFEATPTFDEKGTGRLRYTTVLKLLNSGFKEYVTFYKNKPSAVWAYNPETQQFLSYDNTQLIREKANYIKKNYLAGAMVWLINYDASSDSDESLLVTMAKNL